MQLLPCNMSMELETRDIKSFYRKVLVSFPKDIQ